MCGAHSSLLFIFAVQYTIRKVWVNEEGLKLNGTHLPYADDVNRLSESVYTIKKNTDALVVASKEIELEVNADKTTYMVMSHDQNAGCSHRIKTDNSSSEKVEQVKYWGTVLMNRNSIQGKIKSKLKSGNT